MSTVAGNGPYRNEKSHTTGLVSRKRQSMKKGVPGMYIGGGTIVLILVIVLIVFLVRR
jgi:hypothetical protein